MRYEIKPIISHYNDFSNNQVIICRDTLLRMHDFTASDSTDSFGLAWGPDTIDKEQGTSPEEEEEKIGCLHKLSFT